VFVKPRRKTAVGGINDNTKTYLKLRYSDQDMDWTVPGSIPVRGKLFLRLLFNDY
jgi:hypothetical protein